MCRKAPQVRILSPLPVKNNNPTVTTLLLALRDKQVLLAMKKRGFGAGLFNGAGGKVMLDDAGSPSETVEEAMLRETQEELGITPTQYEKAAEIFFDDVPMKNTVGQILMHVFLATRFNGTPIESEEMKPMWFNLDKIPYDRMFPDDRLWLPHVLQGKKVKAYFKFDKDFKVTEQSIRTCSGAVGLDCVRPVMGLE